MFIILESKSSGGNTLFCQLEGLAKEVKTMTGEEEVIEFLREDTSHTIEMVFVHTGDKEEQICRRIRLCSQVPLFAVLDADSAGRIPDCLEEGADDALAEPYSERELQTRIQAVLRRAMMDYPRVAAVTIGDNVIDFQKARVTRLGREVNLTSMEYKLLLILIRHKNTVLTRMEILDVLYNDLGEYVNDNTLTVYIKRLRSKLADEKGRYIRTVRGIGYSLLDDLK
ncbi:MAG: response regulator transcription factor [Solobacterium sp.]|nr:response regulator transcription factor [Solobacterium sp.]